MTAAQLIAMARRVALAGAVGICLSACGAGDVQLNGKVFDAIGGLVGSSGANQEARIAPRAGLVVPPGLDNLPQPGEASVPDGALAGIADHDRKKVVDKSALEGKQREYCKVHYEQAKQRGDQSADMASGPLGSCRPSAMGLVNTVSGKE